MYRHLQDTLIVVLLCLVVAGLVSLWNAGNVEDHEWALTFSSGGRFLAVQSDRGMTIYEPRGMGAILHVPLARGVAFTTDENTVAIASSNTIVVHDLVRDVRVAEFPSVDDYLVSAAFSPDSALVASLGMQNGVLQVSSVDAARALWKVQVSERVDNVVAFSPDGRLVISGGPGSAERSRDITFRDSDSGDSLFRITVHRHAYVREMLFLEGGNKLMIVFSDAKPNVVFDIRDPNDVRELPGHALSRMTGHVVLSHDERHAAIRHNPNQDWSQAMQVIDLETDTVVLQAGGSRGLWWTAAFSEDDQIASLATSGGTVTDWDMGTGQRIGIYEGNRAPRRVWYWFALGGVGLAWLGAWVVLFLVAQRVSKNGLALGNGILIPVTGAWASAAIATLHWLIVADPWLTPLPHQALPYVAFAVAMAAGVTIIAAIASRAWRALIVASGTASALLISTTAIWFAVIASI